MSRSVPLVVNVRMFRAAYRGMAQETRLFLKGGGGGVAPNT